MLQPIAENLWVVDHPLKFYGLPIDSRMSVIRLNAGELVVISPIQISPEIYQKLQPSILERLALRDRPSAIASIKTMLSWDFDRVIMAHGSIVETDGKRRLREGYEWYLKMPLD